MSALTHVCRFNDKIRRTLVTYLYHSKGYKYEVFHVLFHEKIMWKSCFVLKSKIDFFCFCKQTFKINLSLSMCVLFCSSFVCISAYANVYFNTNNHKTKHKNNTTSKQHSYVHGPLREAGLTTRVFRRPLLLSTPRVIEYSDEVVFLFHPPHLSYHLHAPLPDNSIMIVIV